MKVEAVQAAKRSTIIVLFVGLFISTIPTFGVFKVAAVLREKDFALAARDRIHDLQIGLMGSIGEIFALGAIIAASPEVDATQFRIIAQSLLRHEPNILALEWAPRVRHHDRPAFEDTGRKQLHSDFQIRERDASGQLRAALPRADYFPVLHMEPPDPAVSVIGFDLASEDTRRATLVNAAHSEEPATTGRIRLVQDSGALDAGWGVLVVSAVRRGSLPLAGESFPPADLVGFVVGVYRIGDMIHRVLDVHSNHRHMDVYIFDDHAMTDQRLLFTTASSSRSVEDLTEGVHVQDSFAVGNRQWTIVAAPMRDVSLSWHVLVPILGTLLAGLTLTGLLAYHLGKAEAWKSRTLELVDSVSRNEQRLHDVVERMPALFDAFNADGAIVAWNAECERVTGYTRQEIVGNPRAMELLYPDAEYRQSMQAEWKTRGHDYHNWVWNLTAKNGSRRVIAWSNVSRHCPIPGWETWGVGTDITELHEIKARLQESEIRFRSAFENAGIGMVLSDLDGIITSANPAFCSMLGYAQQELVGRTYFDITHPDDRAATTQLRNQLFMDHRPIIAVEKRYLRKLGGICWGLLSATVIKNNDGEPLYTLASVQDITQRRQFEIALRDSEETKRLIFEAVSDTIIMVDPGGKCLAINRSAACRFGLAQDVMVGMNVFDLMPPEVALRRRGHVNATVQSKHEMIFEDERAGLRLESKLHPVLGEDGEVKAIVVVARDVTERRRAERALSREKERAERYLDIAGTMIVALDTDRRITLINRKGCEVLGWTREEIAGKDWIDTIIPNDQRPAAISQFKSLSTEDSRTDELSESTIITRGGNRRIVAWRHVSIFDEAHRFAGVLISGEDVTARREAAAEHRSMEAQLHRAQRLETVGQMAGGMAHEFNNILVPMIGLTEMVRDDLPEGGGERANLDMVLAAGERARQLVAKILAFGRVKAETDVEFVVLNHVIRDCVVLLRTIIPKTIDLVADIPDHDLAVRCNPDHIHQIMMNLGRNANDALGGVARGRIEIALSHRDLREDDSTPAWRDLKAGRYLSLRVRDSGAGMSQEVQERIFEPFFTTKDVGQGTGMGLAVVHGIVQRYGGAIRVVSAIGAGTEFEILLPVETADQTPGIEDFGYVKNGGGI